MWFEEFYLFLNCLTEVFHLREGLSVPLSRPTWLTKRSVFLQSSSFTCPAISYMLAFRRHTTFLLLMLRFQNSLMVPNKECFLFCSGSGAIFLIFSSLCFLSVGCFGMWYPTCRRCVPLCPPPLTSGVICLSCICCSWYFLHFSLCLVKKVESECR